MEDVLLSLGMKIDLLPTSLGLSMGCNIWTPVGCLEKPSFLPPLAKVAETIGPCSSSGKRMKPQAPFSWGFAQNMLLVALAGTQADGRITQLGLVGLSVLLVGSGIGHC